MQKKLFLLAAEPSADLLGADLIPALKADADLYGVGGPKMRAQGFTPLLPMEEFQIMGLVDTIINLPKLALQFRTLRNTILRENPDGVVLIDYPGFHLRLAKSLRKHGYRGKLIQYVSPTVWAWGKGRIETIGRYYDALLCLFPFEPPLYAHTPVKTTYVGTPVANLVASHSSPPLPWMDGRPVVALFPGSRKREIINNLNLELRIAESLYQQFPETLFAVSCSHPDYLPLIEANTSLPFHIVPREETYSLMQHCHMAIAKSGTCNLELALFQKPALIVYHVDKLNRFLAKHVLRLQLTHVSMPNIIAGKTLYPEFVIHPYEESELFAAAADLYQQSTARATCISALEHLKKTLQSPTKTPSEAILEALR